MISLDKLKLEKLITKRIKDHVLEVDACSLNKDNLHKKFINVKESLRAGGDGAEILKKELGKLVILKDKALYHKGAAAGLQDLLNDIKAWK